METTRIESRAQEPVAKLLCRELYVPHVYLEVCWPPQGGIRVDVLAIDRAGIGDAHIVQIRESADSALNCVPDLMKAPSHFRWIAFNAETVTAEIKARLESKAELDPPAGAGRVGAIAIERASEDNLIAKIVVYAERFHGLKYSQIGEYVKGLEPDMYIRE